MTFEESFKNLEDIKVKLENPETSFDDALKLYSESAKWIKSCLDILNECEGKITAVKEEIDGFIEKPFNVSEE